MHPCRYGGCKGEKSVPEWYSPSPVQENATDARQDLLHKLEEQNAWDKAPQTLQGMLLNKGDMLVRCRKIYGETWFFSLADAGAPGKMCWPATCLSHQGKVYYTLKLDVEVEECPFLHVWNHKDWEAVAIEWLSPIALSIQHRYAPMPTQGPLAAPTGEVMPLIKHAALEAFWDFAKTPLVEVAKEIGAPHSAKDELMPRLYKIMHKVLVEPPGFLHKVLPLL